MTSVVINGNFKLSRWELQDLGSYVYFTYLKTICCCYKEGFLVRFDSIVDSVVYSLNTIYFCSSVVLVWLICNVLKDSISCC